MKRKAKEAATVLEYESSLDDLIKLWNSAGAMDRAHFMDFMQRDLGIEDFDNLRKNTPTHLEYMQVLGRKIDLEFGLDQYLNKKPDER